MYIPDPYQKLVRRIEELGLKRRDLDPAFIDALGHFQESVEQGVPDDDLQELANLQVSEWEQALHENPFWEPGASAASAAGKILTLEIPNGLPLKTSFTEGEPCYVPHILVGGATGVGKSYFQSHLIGNAAPDCHSLVLDAHRFYRNLACMHQHQCVRLNHLRINFWDVPEGVPPEFVDQTVNAEMSQHYGLQYGEMELNEAAATIRTRGETPNLRSMIQELESKRYPPGSRRVYYRDSALLVLRNLEAAMGATCRCIRGMPVSELCSRNLVLEIDRTLPKHAAFLARWFFEHLHLLALTGKPMAKPLLVCFDEGQAIITKNGTDGLVNKLLQLRHYGVRTLWNFQNFSVAPVEIVGNCGLLVCFRSPDNRDRIAFGRCGNLNPEQIEALAHLPTGEACFVLSGSQRPRPGLGKVPRLAVRFVSDVAIEVESDAFASRIPWTPLDHNPIQEPKLRSGNSKSSDQKFDSDTRNFLNEVLNQAHEFSALTQRFERAGVRSFAKQKIIADDLQAQGLIRQVPLAVGRGRPITLCEPTEKAFKEFKVVWKASGRGDLATRAAQEFVFQKMRKLGWHCQKEGMLKNDANSKAVDVLCRDPEGKVVTIEIVGSAGHEVHNAMFCVKNPDVRKYVVVALNKQILEEVKRKFEGFPELKGNPKIEILLLSQALSEKWMP